MKRTITLFAFLTVALIANSAMAQDAAKFLTLDPSVAKAAAWAAALVMGLAAAMGTFSQSRAAATALEGIARNPQAADKMGTPLILSLALMESLVILSFVIALGLSGNVGIVETVLTRIAG